MVQDADGVDQVKSLQGEWQVEEVCLENQDIRQRCAQLGCLRDRRAQIGGDDPCTMGTSQSGITAAATTGIEHKFACQIPR